MESQSVTISYKSVSQSAEVSQKLVSQSVAKSHKFIYESDISDEVSKFSKTHNFIVRLSFLLYHYIWNWPLPCMSPCFFMIYMDMHSTYTISSLARLLFMVWQCLHFLFFSFFFFRTPAECFLLISNQRKLLFLATVDFFHSEER